MFSLLVGASVRLRRPDHQATLHFFWLTVAFFGVLAFSYTGRLDALDWTFYWGDLTAQLLLPPLCQALGEWTGGPMPDQPLVSRAAEARTLRARLQRLTHMWRRTTGVPAPVVVPAN
jgi:hypothetical protein